MSFWDRNDSWLYRLDSLPNPQDFGKNNATGKNKILRRKDTVDRNEVMAVLQNIFADVFADKDIRLTEAANADDIEAWDSLTHITILEAVQDEYQITFDLDEIIELNTAGDIVDAVLAKMG